jgi:DeoR family transcriptional regulator, aga operon transcriptional repressor
MFQSRLTTVPERARATASSKRAERMVRILALLKEREQLSAQELCVELEVSPATMRRDLSDLEEQGLLSRTHGGARPFTGPAELPMRLRDTQSRDAKQAIARKVAQLLPLERRLAIALSGGSTTAEVARCLATRRNLTIVTNSLSLAAEIGGRQNLQVIMTGGVVRPSSFELVGSLAENTFNAINVNIAILGADGVSCEAGATTHDAVEARTNAAMVSHAQRLMVVADGSKIARLTLAKVASAGDIDDLVTDTSADPDELHRLEALGVRIHLVQARP